jgi:hypothetical protein
VLQSPALQSPAPAGELPQLPRRPGREARRRVAATTALLAALMCLAAWVGIGALVAVALLAVAALATGWPALLALPSPRGTTALIALGGTLCVLAVGLTRDEPLLSWLAVALAGLGRGRVRAPASPARRTSTHGRELDRRARGSDDSGLAQRLGSHATHRGGAAGVLVTALPAAVALTFAVLPASAVATGAAGVLAAAGAGAALGQATTTPVAASAAAGALAAVVALVTHRLLAVLPAAGWTPGWLALAVAPLSSSGMVAYVAVRLLVG